MSATSISQTAPVWAYPPDSPLTNAYFGNGTPGNAAEIWVRAGQVPLQRIVMHPAPGTATEDDAIYSKERLNLSCELVNGILVAKTMGFFESNIAAALIYFLHQYLETHPIGIVAGGDGPCETLPEQIRKPDVSFVSFEHIRRESKATRKKLPYSPDLAVEVLSPGNTTAEMETKLKEYFESGSRLVWYIESELKTARSFTAPNDFEDIPTTGSLHGGDVLPGFELSLAKLFDKAGPRMDG